MMLNFQYQIQIWKVFRWKTQEFSFCEVGVGERSEPIIGETKDKCLNRFLAINLITKKYLVITEYPTIKKY